MAVSIAGKVALEIARDPNRAVKVGFSIIFALLGFLLLLILPLLIFSFPAAESDTYDRYYEAAEAIYADTGVFVDWQELIALDTVLKEQEIEDITKEEILREYRKLFVIETTISEETSCGYFDPPEKKCYKDVKKYSRRSLTTVMTMLHLNEEQIEQLTGILESDLTEMLSDKYQNNYPIGGGGGTATVSEHVLRWKPLVQKYAIINGIESYVSYILAQIQQESGGTMPDVMQSSESLGLPPNTITDPEYSIEVGVKYFANILRSANGDIKLALQSYNFGGGFITYALDRGGYSKSVAIEFSQMKAIEKGWSRYGDVNYVDNVLRYYSAEISPAPGLITFDFNSILSQLRKYEGWRYVWGGRSPSQGGFDCSGLLEYVLGNNGIRLSGTAEDMFQKTISINESDAVPGDLVFFKTTEKEISHVGMYIGNGKFYDANNGGVGESNLKVWKKLYEFKGFRRIS